MKRRIRVHLRDGVLAMCEDQFAPRAIAIAIVARSPRARAGVLSQLVDLIGLVGKKYQLCVWCRRTLKERTG